MLRTITPIDNTVYVERDFANYDQIEKALDFSKKLQIQWKNTPLTERIKIITLFVENFLKNNEEVEEQLCKQIGRPISQCSGEMNGFKERAIYMIEKSNKALENVISKKNSEFDNFIVKEPLGTIFIIAPWNYPCELVLSRGNKSVRLFKKIVNCLSMGQQPTIEEINDVGYLLRTTAVYGSGKFGLSDFDRTRSTTHFDQPFRAEMLAVYIIREFSIHLVEHIAYHQNPSQAAKLDASIKRHIGIGNSTGLGMAPFIIKHPKLIHKWMSQFEKSLNEITKIKHIDERKLNKLSSLLKKSKSYLDEVLTTDDYQKTKNKKSFYELDKIIDYCKSIKTSDLKDTRWNDIIKYSEANLSFDAQEIVKVQIIELFPEIADPLAEDMSESDDLFIDAGATVNELINIIESRYKWSINTDFQNKNNTYLFWYVSEEKLEPRLGERYNEQGAELEQHLGIGKMVSELYHFLKENSVETKNLTIAKFLLLHPEYRGIIRRIQTLTNYPLGEVSDNILAKNTLPLNMLRFKLSFFGASRYDPKSDRWLRVSFFAGAPFYEELNSQNVEDWGFATMNSYQ